MKEANVKRGRQPVAAVVPARHSTAATIKINGSGFSPTTANNKVTFNNGAIGTVTIASATSLTVTLTTKPTVVAD